MKKHQIFLFANVFFILGVGVRSFFKPSIYLFFILALLCAVLIFIVRNPKLRLLMIGGIFLCLGVFRYAYALPNFDDRNFVSFYNGKKVEIEGVVCNEVDERINKSFLAVCSKKIKFAGKEQGVYGKIRVTTRLYPQYSYGDAILFSGKLEAPKPFDDFSYDRYLARYSIHSVISYPKIKILSRHQGNVMYEKILNMKNFLTHIVDANMHEPQASILNAIVFGKRGGMPDEIQNQMAQSGIIHLIAISGSHITLIIAMLMAVAPYFYVSRGKAFYIISFLIILYTILIGWPASAVRAAVMGWIAAFAIKNGRLANTKNTLIFAASIMLLFNPFILRDDIGFQLSFAAVWGIFTFIPMWQERFENIPESFGLKEVLLMTLAAFVSTFPLTLYYFERVSFISPIANIFVVPIFLPLMVIVPFSFILTLLAPGYGQYFFLAPYAIVSYLVGAGKFFSQLPLSFLEVSHIPIEAAVILYFFILFFSYRNLIIEHYVKKNI